MSAKITNGYTPPEHFKEVDKLPSVVEEAGDDNTELWLIRLPANEIGQADLQEKRMKLNVNASEGVIGHFFNGQGKDNNIIKHSNVKTLQPYAVIPNGVNPFIVRKITCQVGFVKSSRVEGKHPNEEKSHELLDKDVGETHDQTSGLASEKQESALLDIEKPSKKKRRRPELSENN